MINGSINRTADIQLVDALVWDPRSMRPGKVDERRRDRRATDNNVEFRLRERGSDPIRFLCRLREQID